jgi:hypothetical protein
MPHLFDKLLWATPIQICWKWSAREFYYVHDPDCPHSAVECLNTTDLRNVKCLFVCECSACQQHAFPDKNVENFIKNVEQKHCIYCQCENCVCDLRKMKRQYDLRPKLYYWDSSCFDANCQVCFPPRRDS